MRALSDQTKLRRYFFCPVLFGKILRRSALQCGISRNTSLARAWRRAHGCDGQASSFARRGNGLEGLCRIVARDIGAAKRFEGAVHRTTLIEVFAAAALLFIVVSPL